MLSVGMRRGSGRGARRLAGVVVLLATALGAGCEAQGGSSVLTDERLGLMIDSMLPEIAGASGLDVRKPVRSAVQPRAEARAFLERQLEEELGAEELAGAERAYRAFGLIPDTLDLRSLLLELYSEQVVGYYDPETERLYVVEGIRADSAAAAVAHELVHALQDQHADLDSLVSMERGNDRQMAAQAAVEGHATLVMIALETARRTGRPIDPGDLPDLGGFLEPALSAQSEQFPVFGRAPRLIRETLVFPYFGGAAFVQELHRDAGRAVAPFGEHLPQSTEQVLSPEDRFLTDRDAPTELELGAPASGWRVVYSNGLGQLETSIFLAEHLGDGARSGAAGWDGDRYALLEGPGAVEALVWYSVWDDDAAADRFARAYRATLQRRPGREARVERLEHDGRPVVKVVETRRGLDPASVPTPPLVSLVEVPER